MAFPDDPLVQKTEIALGADINGDPGLWSWTDISTYVQTADGANIKVDRGRRNDSGAVPPATMSFQLDNSDGRFCTQYPMSPYFPLLQVNTPVKFSVSTDSGSSWSTRFSGYLGKLPTTWRGPGGSNSWVSVTAQSVLRRLGEEGARSPLRWTAPALTSSGTGCIEYWPMEDGKDAAEVASYFPAGIAMTAAGSVELGSSSPPSGSKATPQSDYEFMKANPPSLTAIVRPYTDTSKWSALTCFKIESDAAWSTTLMDCAINVGEGSTDPDQIRLVVTQSLLILYAYQADDTVLGSVNTGAITTRPPGDGEWHAVAVLAEKSGSDVIFRVRYEGVTYSATLTSKTLGTVRGIACPSPVINTEPDTLAVGHLAVYDDALSSTAIDTYAAAMNSHLTAAGERVDLRLSRLGNETSLIHSISAVPGETAMWERLGEQSDGNVLSAIEDAVEADGGILYEPRDFADDSLECLSRSAINVNALGTPSMTLTQGHFSILEQGDDDHYLATSVTVTGAGSSATASAGVVENDEPASRNIRHPDRLPDMAGWVLYQGTRRDYRYPRIQILLHGATGLIAAWKTTELGDRILINDPPPGVVDDIDLILEGYSEMFTQYAWTVELHCSPASRYRIARLDHTVYGRMDTAGARLVNAVSSSATTLDVETATGPEWTTTAGFDLGVGGERMTASAITGSFSDAFTRTVANGWGTSTSGHVWSTNGGTAADYSTNGSRGIISLGAVNALRSTYIDALQVANLDRTFITRVPVLATGAGVLIRQTARWDLGVNSYYAAGLQVETDQSVTAQVQAIIAGSVTTLATRTVAGLTHGTTTDFRLRFRLDGPRLFMKLWSGATEPVQWTLTAYDTQLTAAGSWGYRVRLNSGNTNALPVNLQFDTDATVHPQRFTVTREVNPVTKPHAPGAAVGLFQPNHLGL